MANSTPHAPNPGGGEVPPDLPDEEDYLVWTRCDDEKAPDDLGADNTAVEDLTEDLGAAADDVAAEATAVTATATAKEEKKKRKRAAYAALTFRRVWHRWRYSLNRLSVLAWRGRGAHPAPASAAATRAGPGCIRRGQSITNTSCWGG